MTEDCGISKRVSDTVATEQRTAGVCKQEVADTRGWGGGRRKTAPFKPAVRAREP
ncbi:MAG: hypothetical protein LBK25_01805 [Treponema sp.]|nr:hypothetical protein [Treponema sp.]